MTRAIHILPTIASLLVLGACSSFEERYQASAPNDQRHPVEVSTEVAVLEVATDSRGAMTARARSDVDMFMRSFQADGSGVLEVQTSSGAADVASTQIRDLARLNGIPANKLTRRSFSPQAGSSAIVRLAFARYVASVPTCADQDWSEDLGKTWDNTPYKSFGCSVQVNIAAQVADPRDLVASKPMDAASADRRGTIFDKYEKGQKTASENEAKEDSTVSSIAK